MSEIRNYLVANLILFKRERHASKREIEVCSENVRYRRDEILQNRKREPNVEDAIAYFDSMATYVDELRKLQKELRHMIR